MIDLSDIMIERPDESPVRVGDIVDRPTIVDLPRYYGCAPCRAYLRDLGRRHEEITARGGAVIAVGPAAHYQAAALQKKTPVPLYLDPQRRVAEAVGLGRQSVARFLFDPRGWGRYARGVLRGGRQGWITAGAGELPGILVLDAGARLEWSHLGRTIGDYPPLEVVLKHLDGAL